MKKNALLGSLVLALAVTVLLAGCSTAPPAGGAATSAAAASADKARPRDDALNVTSPGPTGGSCSATSDDGKRTCSIACKAGQSANCSNTATTANCSCSL